MYSSQLTPRTQRELLENWNLSLLTTRSALLQLRTFHGCLPPRTAHKWASVSPISPRSDRRETFLPKVLQLLRHCWNAWHHCWSGHVTLPHSCVIEVFIAVAWQQPRRGDTRLVTAGQGSARPGTEKTPLRLLLRNRGNVFRCYSYYMA
jgi:hypothetical protein